MATDSNVNAQLIGDSVESTNQLIKNQIAKMNTAFPAIITNVNYGNMTCDVQPATQRIIADAKGVLKPITLPVVVDCPVVLPSGGGFIITTPYSVGDEVLVIISQRCIDNWWENGTITPPAELRMHDLSDGFAIIGVFSKTKKISNYNTTDMEIRNKAGTNKIILKANGTIEIDTTTININATTANINATTTNISGNLNVGGVATVGGLVSNGATSTMNGNLHTTGTITADNGVSSNGITLNGHHHGGVAIGGNNTGAPNGG